MPVETTRDEISCAGGDHRAPSSGGSCACGMVTRIPARRPAPRPEVRDLLARCLHDGPDDPFGDRGAGAEGTPDAAALRRRADRLLAALAEAGLVVAPGAAGRLTA